MYGTIFRLQPKAGREADVVSLMEAWNRERGTEVPGARATYLLQSERRPGELIGVAVFDDERTYRANAAAPEQDAWYRRLREALETDPVWEDGAFLVATQIPARAGALARRLLQVAKLRLPAQASPPTLLFYQGRFLPDQMRRTRVLESDVRAAIREQGVATLVDVEAVVLETDGSFAVVKRSELEGVLERDEQRYVLVCRDLAPRYESLGKLWPRSDRPPFPLETSLPGVFAIGDIRHHSVKRVASAVGAGAMAIASVHEYLGEEAP